MSSILRFKAGFTGQRLAGLFVAVVVAILVLYPIFFLLQAALNVGDPDARPPTAYGSSNFGGLLDYPQIIVNTVVVSTASTIMALVFGFVMAWILSRTNVPGRATLEQLMAVPYYVTPLLGALAWSLLGSPESGFVNQVWRALGGEGHVIDINNAYGIAFVMALFEGSVAFVMIGGSDEVDGPVARGSFPGAGRRPLAHDAEASPCRWCCRGCSARQYTCSPRCSARSRRRWCLACRTGSTW